MPKRDTHGTRPELKMLVAEASRALTALDAARLEELALCCAALNRELENADSTRRIEVARQARDAQADLAVFGRILTATRANVAVVERIRALRRDAILEYRLPGATAGGHHGND